MHDHPASRFSSPTLQATIQQRILVNDRVAPEALAAVLPPPFRPSVVGGHGVAGLDTTWEPQPRLVASGRRP